MRKLFKLAAMVCICMMSSYATVTYGQWEIYRPESGNHIYLGTSGTVSNRDQRVVQYPSAEGYEISGFNIACVFEGRSNKLVMESSSYTVGPTIRTHAIVRSVSNQVRYVRIRGLRSTSPDSSVVLPTRVSRQSAFVNLLDRGGINSYASIFERALPLSQNDIDVVSQMYRIFSNNEWIRVELLRDEHGSTAVAATDLRTTNLAREFRQLINNCNQ